jgi:hypothetical protein
VINNDGQIPNNGQILGGCGDANDEGHYLLRQNGTFTDLGTLALGNGPGPATTMNNLAPDRWPCTD